MQVSTQKAQNLSFDSILFKHQSQASFVGIQSCPSKQTVARLSSLNGTLSNRCVSLFLGAKRFQRPYTSFPSLTWRFEWYNSSFSMESNVAKSEMIYFFDFVFLGGLKQIFNSLPLSTFTPVQIGSAPLNTNLDDAWKRRVCLMCIGLATWFMVQAFGLAGFVVRSQCLNLRSNSIFLLKIKKVIVLKYNSKLLQSLILLIFGGG